MATKKKKIDIRTLVALALTTARNDKSSPNENNLRTGWRFDELLQDIDKLLQSEKLGSLVLMEFGLGLREGLKSGEFPAEAMLARLVELRGARLQLPMTDEVKADVRELSEWIEGSFESISDALRRERCKSLYAYNMGVYCDAAGEFGEAATIHRMNAEKSEAQGDMGSAKISRFMAYYYGLKEKIVMYSGQLTVVRDLPVFEKRVNELCEAMRGTKDEVQWTRGNAPIHMILVCTWLGVRHDRLEEWAQTALSAAETLGPAWAVPAKLADKCVKSLRHGENEMFSDEATASLRAIMENTAVAAEHRATAMLLLVREAIRDQNLARAGNLLEDFNAREGAQHVVAVAVREHKLAMSQSRK